MKFLLLFLWLFVFQYPVTAQLQSPDQFLGYRPGTQFTPHHMLVGYFRYIAERAPSRVKLEQYGLTNEGRPLVLCFIASEANAPKLELIRKNNMRLANIATDNIPPREDIPAIVWLSYNVHGNEASSSEASMLTLYALADPGNDSSKEWLKNTIVIIDPCINPDGRDRYVNWFNSVRGTSFNPDPQAREHREPWPGGRTNHYNYDLNRDWAWQTQVETKQRVKKYNEWLPQVHVDFHEQSYNNPYYFAPAAQPYHEVITAWQRDFQMLIGKNNARYFDKNGWLYFTKGGGYDLFYPSYGDTYPTYHGAIGMTFEQGGGGAGGLGVITQDGDTLTLEDRVAHHFTTGLSTIEIASRNALKLVREFRKFYNDALTAGVGEYKTFIIKRRSTSADLEAVLNRYLDNNGISSGVAQANANYKGFNFISGREESMTVEKGDIVLTSYQPKSTMLKVLFEPRSRQSEVKSRPYDITAWSLPYALGLEAFALKDRVIPGPSKSSIADSSLDRSSLKSAYAFIIPWKNFSSAKVLSRLLQLGVRVRYQEQAFTANGKDYEAGTLVITRAANARFGDNLYDSVARAVYRENDFHYGLQPVFTGFMEKGGDLGSNRVKMIPVPKIALLTGEGTDVNAAGTVWHFFEKELHYPVTLINANDMARADLRQYNVLVMPNAINYRFLDDRLLNDQLKAWVRQGGKLIALEGAVSELSKADWGLRAKLEDEKKKKLPGGDSATYQPVRKFDDRVVENLSTLNSGTIYKVNLDNSHPLGYGYPDYYFTLKQDDAVYEFIREGGWNVGYLKKDNFISGFLGSKAQEKLKDGLLFGVQEMGRGSVVYLADDVLFRSFWENGKLLFCNAVFMVGQ
ncbi:MAG: M14 family metallopeptidase [Chitinophagaceae bacterium]